MLPAMNLPGMILRLEKSSDFAAIRTVEKAAFPGPAEAQLVDDLRNAGDSVLSLVAIENATVIGHAMLSKLKAPFPALALGPVAVLPGRQRMGVGTQLIRSGIAHSKAAGSGESGEGNHAAMRLARYSSSQPAVLRLRRMESLPGAFRVRL